MKPADVLAEAMALQKKKSEDYQSAQSDVKHADYFPRGLDTINDLLHIKLLRVRSVLAKGTDTNFESLRDSYIDLINYASFAAAYVDGDLDGQDKNNDY